MLLRGGSCCRGALWSVEASLRAEVSSEPLREDDMSLPLMDGS